MNFFLTYVSTFVLLSCLSSVLPCIKVREDIGPHHNWGCSPPAPPARPVPMLPIYRCSLQIAVVYLCTLAALPCHETLDSQLMDELILKLPLALLGLITDHSDRKKLDFMCGTKLVQIGPKTTVF